MKKLIRFIESANFVYATTLSLLAVQIMQTAHLFHRVSRLDLTVNVAGYHITAFGWLHSLCCTFAIEAAVLMLIVNGRKVAARWYAFASLLCSLLYFGDWELLVYGGWEPLLPRLVATSLFSAMLAGSVLFFSELFTGKMLEQKATEQKATEQKATEQKANEQKANEQKANEQKMLNALLLEQKAAKQKAAKQKAAEQNALEQKMLEQKANGQKLFASKSGKPMASAAGGIGLPDGYHMGLNGKLHENGHATPVSPPVLPADGADTFACTVCGRGFGTVQALNGHMRGHRNGN